MFIYKDVKNSIVKETSNDVKYVFVATFYFEYIPLRGRVRGLHITHVDFIAVSYKRYLFL